MISTLTGSSDSVISNAKTVSKINSARLECENVYNVAPGQIIYIGAENGRAIVNIQVNPSEILRYGNLKEVNCKKGYYADEGAQIGVADNQVIFEYCTLWRGQSNYPVRIGSFTYFKQNPSDVLEGTYTVRKDGAQEQGYVFDIDRVRFTDEQKAVFGENVLDKNDEIRKKQKWSTPKSEAIMRSIGLIHRPNKASKDPNEPDNPEEDIDWD